MTNGSAGVEHCTLSNNKQKQTCKISFHGPDGKTVEAVDVTDRS